ncbi:enoyl-[acyl-carrier-protein] reductase FabL [Alicyclobacillus sp. TC]|nr:MULTISPECIES: enoyl-[acyl-carrier-protein] reductase FabL [Alicyclobacillus]MDP9728196.1 enoyl-[acyl-carrier protein] reductase III [Alicyclobacillus tengchongensis]QRF23418.1 enoyl-[acyl-carrier-protein] reductase FabL [Alicyclobacillus sp. TC]
MSSHSQQRRYKDKVVCVSGSSRGIGKQLALAYAQEGADVVIHYFRNGEAAREVVAEVEKMGRRALMVKANLAEEHKIHSMFDEIEKYYGKLDVYVHNAASGRNRKALDVDVKGWDWTQNVNARSLLIAAQRAVPLMAEGSSLLAISSFGSDHVFPFYTSVGASKAAIESLIRYLAIELAPQRINANAISAGAVETGALEHFPEIERTWEQVKERLPYHRMVTSEDVAHLALFLTSKEAEMIRGQTIRMDGGITLLVP